MSPAVDFGHVAGITVVVSVFAATLGTVARSCSAGLGLSMIFLINVILPVANVMYRIRALDDDDFHYRRVMPIDGGSIVVAGIAGTLYTLAHVVLFGWCQPLYTTLAVCGLSAVLQLTSYTASTAYFVYRRILQINAAAAAKAACAEAERQEAERRATFARRMEIEKALSTRETLPRTKSPRRVAN